MAASSSAKLRGSRYSELECFVLGVIWQFGPCSPYDIRRHLAASPSTQWSGSAGAIYPLVQKLEKRKLLKARDHATGKRRRREYVITPAGRRVLQAWVGPPLGRDAVSVAYDPLRTRARFLGAATPTQRAAWVRAAAAALDEVGRMVKKWQEQYGTDDPLLALMTRSGELDVESRREWLRAVAGAMGEEPAVVDRAGSGRVGRAGEPAKRAERGRGG